MEKKIEPIKLFATPENMKDLEDRLNAYSSSEKTVAWISAMMAWNLACKIVNETEE